MQNYTYFGAPVDGWHFSPNPELNYYQKVQGNAVVYVEKMLFIYRLTAYRKGEIGVCTLEARIASKYSPESLFGLGQEWLEKYHEWNEADLLQDPYHIANPDGYWGFRYGDKKLFYLNNQEGWSINES